MESPALCDPIGLRPECGRAVETGRAEIGKNMTARNHCHMCATRFTWTVLLRTQEAGAVPLPTLGVSRGHLEVSHLGKGNNRT